MIGRGRVVRPCRVLLGRLSVRVLRVQCLLCTLLCKRCADVSTTPAISEIGLRSAPECGRVEEEGHGTSCRNRQSRTYPGARSSRPFPPLPRRQTKRRSGPWLLVKSAAGVPAAARGKPEVQISAPVLRSHTMFFFSCGAWLCPSFAWSLSLIDTRN